MLIPKCLDPPERAMRAEFGNLTGGLFSDVKRDADDTDKCAGENDRHEPAGDRCADRERVVKRPERGDRRVGGR